MNRLEQRLEEVRVRMGDRPVTLVAVTKNATLAQMLEAYALGLRHFGENRIQEALEKIQALPQADIHWHFIGHLQTNKAAKTVGRFALIHSVDSLKLAERLSALNRQAGRVQPVLLQVNVSGEVTKTGFAPADLARGLPEMARLTGIQIRGLMTIAPLSNDPDLPRSVFRGLHHLREQLQDAAGIPLPELSMGMSNDYLPAIESGATILRIGSFLFRPDTG